MNTNHRLEFGKYVETLRKGRGKSLRETAKAIKVSPQFYSEVEKGRSSAFTAERLKSLACFLLLNDDEVIHFMIWRQNHGHPVILRHHRTVPIICCATVM